METWEEYRAAAQARAQAAETAWQQKLRDLASALAEETGEDWLVSTKQSTHRPALSGPNELIIRAWDHKGRGEFRLEWPCSAIHPGRAFYGPSPPDGTASVPSAISLSIARSPRAQARDIVRRLLLPNAANFADARRARDAADAQLRAFYAHVRALAEASGATPETKKPPPHGTELADQPDGVQRNWWGCWSELPRPSFRLTTEFQRTERITLIVGGLSPARQVDLLRHLGLLIDADEADRLAAREAA